MHLYQKGYLANIYILALHIEAKVKSQLYKFFALNSHILSIPFHACFILYFNYLIIFLSIYSYFTNLRVGSLSYCLYAIS